VKGRFNELGKTEIEKLLKLVNRESEVPARNKSD
jgi:hypothetical protein